MGLVSVIIPVYNRSEYLSASVQSALDQTYRPIEIIIVDDGSTDDTPQLLEELRQKHPHEITIKRIENAGPGGAREAGRQIAQGEFIQYLDSDDILLPEKIHLQVEALKKHPEASIAYGITRLVDENRKVLKEPYKWTGRSFDSLFPALLVDRWWNTQTPLWRRSLCDAMGAWPLANMSEDWRYEARAGALQARLVFVDQVVAETRMHASVRITSSATLESVLPDLVSLVQDLYVAIAGLDLGKEIPEMRHFSRWAYSLARQCLQAGKAHEAKKMFAVYDATTFRKDYSADVLRLLAHYGGVGLAGALCRLLERVSGRKSDTLKQSWVDVS